MKYNFFAFFLFLSLANFAQDSKYTISGHVEGLQDTTVYLANYFGNKLYYNDTTEIDHKGNFVFKGKPHDEGGKYAFVIPGQKYFDFIIADEDIVFETDVKDLVGNLKFKKSDNNKIFFDYVRFISDKKKLRQPLDEIVQDSLANEEAKEKAKEDILKLNDEVINYQKELIQKHPNKLVSKMIKMTMEVIIPDAPDSIQDDPEKVNKWKYYWYRKHYWDNVDLTDPRLVRDPSFHHVTEKYTTQIIPQIPDTVCAEATKLLDRVEGNPEMFKYILHNFTFNAEKSKIMCMDKAFVCLIDKYYKTGKATWMTDEKLKEIIEASDKKKPTLCGAIAPNVILPDTTKNVWKALSDVKADYTVVAIWESTCGHCKKEMPKLLNLAKKFEDKSIVFFAIGNDREYEPWMKFIREHKLYGPNWINVSDNLQIDEPDTARTLIMEGITTLNSLNFRKLYNVTSTPQIFLLDKDKKILAKQLTSEQIEEFVTRWTEEGDKVDEKEYIPEIDQKGMNKGNKKKAKKNKK